ncbi:MULTISPECIES: hypothetical protein [unclassified Leisingera]|uniref:hypothetical protein n=1 Tax=unclassified Leisingera TaxID=2614906 RepID=UPI0005800CF5|nr:hypothetical protein [Leisingera sp. ANG-S5]KIC33226.1 hypothetical protein RA25_08115 [Leisingera sp. ANG-S5]
MKDFIFVGAPLFTAAALLFAAPRKAKGIALAPLLMGLLVLLNMVVIKGCGGNHIKVGWTNCSPELLEAIGNFLTWPFILNMLLLPFAVPCFLGLAVFLAFRKLR